MIAYAGSNWYNIRWLVYLFIGSLLKFQLLIRQLINWGWVTHICVSKLTIIGSDNGLSPGQHQAIICSNDGTLLIRPLGTNFSESLIEIHPFLFKNMHLEMSSAEWQRFCLSLNVLSTHKHTTYPYISGPRPWAWGFDHQVTAPELPTLIIQTHTQT